MMSESSRDPITRSFEMSDLISKRRSSGEPWWPFLTVSTMSAGLYILPIGAKDPQGPHERDELYYVISGRAVLEVEGEDRPVQSGSMIYVKAKAAHHFHSITEALHVLVVFSAAAPS